MARKQREEPTFTIEDLFGEMAEEPEPPRATPPPPPPPPEPPKPPPEPPKPRARPPKAEPGRPPAPKATPAPARAPEPEPEPEPSKPGTGGPRTLDCGHMDWFTAEEHEAARAGGKCCAGHGGAVDWRSLRGEFVRPVPPQFRRTREKERGLGYPGLCCNDEGYYVGGLGNDCRRWRPEGEPLCTTHRPWEPPPPEPDPDPEPVAVEGAEPAAPAAGRSWKERQRELRKKQPRK